MKQSGEVVDVPIGEINVSQRLRKDPGDIDALARSIERVGLLQPPVVDREWNLIAGFRRLTALRRLEWASVPVFVVDSLEDAVKRLVAERDENTCRKDLTPSEMVLCASELDRLERKDARVRSGKRTDRPGGKFPPGSAGKTRDRVASAFGVSGRTYEKAKGVCDSGDEQLIAEMDRTGKIDRAFRKLKVKQREQVREDAARGYQPRVEDLVQCSAVRDAEVEPGTVDLVFTDPPYADIEVYADVAAKAAEWLKPGGLCLAYSGQAYLPQILQGMGRHLDYLWTCCIRHTGGAQRVGKSRVLNLWKPVLLFYKPPLERWWQPFCDATTGGRHKDAHEWQQAEAEAAHFIEALSVKGDLVVDPCCGSGTSLAAAQRLGRRVMGFDVDPASVATSLERLRELEPVLQ